MGTVQGWLGDGQADRQRARCFTMVGRDRDGWDPATDNLSPARRIVYDVYQATTPGARTSRTPTYTTEPGVTSFATPELPTDEVFYFVVRARDQAGNRDTNTVEREGQNLCV
jgi:uncharacterized protein RhaS with RHS repeats